MSFTDLSRNFACGVGKCIGAGFSVLGFVGRGTLKPFGIFRFKSSHEKIRRIVSEEIMRFLGGQNALKSAGVEQRLQIMAETIEALQNKIAQLNFQGTVNEADVVQAMDSLDASQLLTEDERTMLVSIFRQNIALQKPELIGSAAE